MVELLLFLVLAFSSRVAGEGLSFEESLHALDKAAKAVQVEDDRQQTERLEELLEGIPFKPHVYTVRITEPPIQTPVQGFKNSWKIPKDPFYTPIPIADKPEVMREIQVVHMGAQPPPANSLLIACATIFIIILLFGSAVLMAHCFYVLSLSHSRSDFDFSSSTSLEGVGSGDYGSSYQAKQKVAFDETGGESMDEMPTLTDESARTIETTRSESEPPARGLDSPTRPPAGADSSTRPPAGLDSSARPPAGADSSTRPPAGADSPARPPAGLDSSARPPAGPDSSTQPPAALQTPPQPPPAPPLPKP